MTKQRRVWTAACAALVALLGCAKAATTAKVETAPPAAQAPAPVEPAKKDAWPDQLALLGEVLTQAKTPPFLARLAREQDGWIGRLDIPGQAAEGLQLAVVQTEERLVFSLVEVDAHWTLGHDDKGELTCSFNQRGVALECKVQPLSEAELVAALTPKRPQTPVAPYPYEVREVAYDNVAGQVRLAGTLTIPQGQGPFPTALLISGSGMQDRDETVMGHKPFWVLADHLSRRGIAVLRVDDRGVGGSTMSGAPTSADFAGDVRAGINFLKTQPGVDPKRIGLIGHSEGALVGSIVAAKDAVAFVVLLAPPAVSGADLLVAQSGALLRAAGAPEPAIAEAQGRQREVVDVVLKEPDDNEARNKLEILLEPRDPSRAQIPLLLSPWFRFFLKHDVQADLSKIRAPVLAVFGERDVQVPYALNQQELGKALKKTKHKHDKVASFPELNHLLQPARTGLPDEYASIETTIAPEVLELVTTWLAAL